MEKIFKVSKGGHWEEINPEKKSLKYQREGTGRKSSLTKGINKREGIRREPILTKGFDINPEKVPTALLLN